MSDNNKYINAYVDIAIGTIHEYLASNIQLKAQNKISNDLLIEKEQIIASLQSEIAKINKNSVDMQSLQNSAKTWEDSYNAMKIKIGHMDTLTSQIIEMKKEVIKRDEKIKQLEDKLVELNKKSKKKQQPISEPEVTKPLVIDKTTQDKKQLPIDDF